jgi:hypothetical protein
MNITATLSNGRLAARTLGVLAIVVIGGQAAALSAPADASVAPSTMTASSATAGAAASATAFAAARGDIAKSTATDRFSIDSSKPAGSLHGLGSMAGSTTGFGASAGQGSALAAGPMGR